MKDPAPEITVSYNLDVPHLSIGVPPEKVQPGKYWKLFGIDGRYAGGHRRFPGFRRLSYTVSTDSWSRDTAKALSDSSAFYFFKYVAVQKAEATHTLRGWVVGLDGSSSDMDLWFLHYDTEDEKWYTYEIVTGLALGTQVDAATVGRNLVVAIDGQSAITIRWVDGYRTDVSTYKDGLVQVDTGPGEPELEAGKGVEKRNNPWLKNIDNFLTRTGEASVGYRIRWRWYDPGRRLWSKLSTPAIEAKGDLVETNNGTSAGTAGAFGLQIHKDEVRTRIQKGFTRLYVYRTILGGGALYLEQIVRFPTATDDAGSGGHATPDADENLMIGPDNAAMDQDYYHVYVGGSVTNTGGGFNQHNPILTVVNESPGWSLGMNDEALRLQRLYDPFLDEEGDPPQSGLIASYQDMMLAAGKGTDEDPTTTGEIRWSTLYHSTPENFPESDHYYRPSNTGHELLSLHGGGDYAFAVRDDVVLRLHRAAQMAVNELHRKMGGVFRYAATTIGQYLYVVAPFGLVSVDGTSGRQDLVASVGRLFVDKEYWGTKLLRGSTHLCFDGAGSTLFMLNTVKEEMYLLWFASGAITALRNCPFIFATRGTHPEDGGPGIAWFLGDSGGIYYVDWDRTNSRQTMLGATSSETVNGTFPSGMAAGDTSVTVSSGETVPANLTGFYVHLLSGGNRGLSRKITSSTAGAGGTFGWDQPLPYDPSGARYSLGPIVIEVGLAVPRRQREVDLFIRKGLEGGMACITMWGGELLQTDNPNLQIIYGVQDGRHTVANEGEGLINEEPTRTAGDLEFKGNQPLPYVKIVCSDVDAELQSIQFYGTITATDADVET